MVGSKNDYRSLLSLDHVLLVDDQPETSCQTFRREYGLSPQDLGRGVTRLCRDHIDLRIVGPGTGDAAVDAYADAHRAGAAVIALRVPDAERAHADAVRRGAEPLEDYPGRGFYGRPAIETPGGYVHVFIERDSAGSASSAGSAEPTGTWNSRLTTMDHFAVCVPAGALEGAASFYAEVMGFTTIFEEKIRVGAQGMNSKVVQNDLRDVTFTIIEPDADHEPGQIDRFLADHGGPGVQHIAFASADVLDTVAGMRQRGTSFLSTPKTYYDRLPERLPVLLHPLGRLRGEHVLVDEDHGGQLYQIFTRSQHPRGTLFFEIIERIGATTFGSSNITALYEAVEAER